MADSLRSAAAGRHITSRAPRGAPPRPGRRLRVDAVQRHAGRPPAHHPGGELRQRRHSSSDGYRPGRASPSAGMSGFIQPCRRTLHRGVRACRRPRMSTSRLSADVESVVGVRNAILSCRRLRGHWPDAELSARVGQPWKSLTVPHVWGALVVRRRDPTKNVRRHVAAPHRTAEGRDVVPVSCPVRVMRSSRSFTRPDASRRRPRFRR
jgi:hypothetical protein